ncbi:hypothetical protein AVEN_49989-1 [Araneus ventricosus]|uniref:Transmembrane protein 127 transmembrane region domain-containing protein n=1 Tax=Araneus ventricosus TaxID=182803 RepID=A0A4Y2D2B9_ARAVE|nr:hypothetical protein AVEN_49989-1 [Araneus ventricosus]
MHSVIPASFVSQASRRSGTERERNIIAAIFSAKVIVLLIMALALPNWYYLKGGGCARQVLGTEQFFYVSSVGTLTVPADGGNISYSKLAYYGLNEDMKDCLTPEIVTVQRIIIGLCFVTIFFSFCQFYFDISGVKNSSLKCTRRCGLGSILSAKICFFFRKFHFHAQKKKPSYLPFLKENSGKICSTVRLNSSG